MSGGARAYQDRKWAARAGTAIARPEPGSRVAVALDQLDGNGRLIDLGCGDGALLALAPGSGIGVDLSPAGLARMPAQIPRVCADLDAAHLPFRDASVETCTFLDALPYVESPLRVLREVARILKPGGRLIVSAPNARQFRHLLGLLAGKPIAPSPEERSYDGGQRHLFTDRSMAHLLDETGFACERLLGLLPAPRASFLRRMLGPIARGGIGRAMLAPGVLAIGRRR
ncbi:MAG: methyltransferase domain-containing protein [Candidatus Eisenbacteria bacterium]